MNLILIWSKNDIKKIAKKDNKNVHLRNDTELEDTARYATLLLAPAEGFSLWPKAFFAFRAKFFRLSLVSSSNLNNF